VDPSARKPNSESRPPNPDAVADSGGEQTMIHPEKLCAARGFPRPSARRRGGVRCRAGWLLSPSRVLVAAACLALLTACAGPAGGSAGTRQAQSRCNPAPSLPLKSLAHTSWIWRGLAADALALIEACDARRSPPTVLSAQSDQQENRPWAGSQTSTQGRALDGLCWDCSSALQSPYSALP
jgi:hypothetical protein